MGTNNTGYACCSYCGAEYRLFTIFNRDMQGLASAWLRRHMRACAVRSPAGRLKWAQPFVGKTALDSALVVDLRHPGFAGVQHEAQTLPLES